MVGKSRPLCTDQHQQLAFSRTQVMIYASRCRSAHTRSPNSPVYFADNGRSVSLDRRRSRLTVTGAVMMTPVTAPALPEAHLTNVRLTADLDPIGLWMHVLEHSATSTGGIFDLWSAAPFPRCSNLRSI